MYSSAKFSSPVYLSCLAIALIALNTLLLDSTEPGELYNYLVILPSSPSQRDLGIPSIKTYFEEEDDDRVDSFESDLAGMKSRYYHEKLGFLRIDDSVLAEQAKCYVVGVQWVLSYYYHGVPSWSW